jgi:hypothetical protein
MIVQQLREVLLLPCRYHCVLFDRDAKFSSDGFEFLKVSGKSIRKSIRSPCQNGMAVSVKVRLGIILRQNGKRIENIQRWLN